MKIRKITLTLITVFTLLISSLGIAERESLSFRLPQSVDHSNSKYLPNVGDQGYINSSVEWALGYYLRTYQQAKDLDWDIKDEDGNDRSDRVFSPSFIYNQINGGKNKTSDFNDVVNLLKYQGIVTLDDFDENSNYNKKPDEKTMSKGYPHRIADSEFINIEESSIEETKRLVKEALVMEDLPVLGTYTGRNWLTLYDLDGKSFVTSYEHLREEGEHAVVIVGYDDGIITPEGRGAFKIVNSWGEDWADDGYAYITYEAFEKHGYYLGLSIDLENKELPVAEVKDIEINGLSPIESRYTWKPSQNATGYRIYDEYHNIIKEVYASTEYIEIFNNSQVKTRYIEAFNNVYSSELVEFIVDPKQYDKENKLEYDRENSEKIIISYNQARNKEWTVRFNNDVMYGDYLNRNIYVIDENNYVQDISIESTNNKSALKIIAPESGYESGKIYTIVIKDVKDTKGEILKNHTFMDFTVK